MMDTPRGLVIQFTEIMSRYCNNPAQISPLSSWFREDLEKLITLAQVELRERDAPF